METYKYLSQLSNEQLIQLATEMNQPSFPEDGLLRQVATDIFGRSDLVIMHALTIGGILSKVLAERLQQVVPTLS